MTQRKGSAAGQEICPVALTEIGTLRKSSVELSHRLGCPEMDCAILGEGNTSARADAETFWVKAFGHELRAIAANGFVRVAFNRVAGHIFSRSKLWLAFILAPASFTGANCLAYSVNWLDKKEGSFLDLVSFYDKMKVIVSNSKQFVISNG